MDIKRGCTASSSQDVFTGFQGLTILADTLMLQQSRLSPSVSQIQASQGLQTVALILTVKLKAEALRQWLRRQRRHCRYWPGMSLVRAGTNLELHHEGKVARTTF